MCVCKKPNTCLFIYIRINIDRNSGEPHINLTCVYILEFTSLIYANALSSKLSLVWKKNLWFLKDPSFSEHLNI